MVNNRDDMCQEITLVNIAASSSHGEFSSGTPTSQVAAEGTTAGTMGSSASSVTPAQLANIFQVPEEKITRVRKNGSLYSLIDITMIVTHNDARYAAKEIGILGQRYPEVWNTIQHLKLPGRGQRETPVGDTKILAHICKREAVHHTHTRRHMVCILP